MTWVFAIACWILAGLVCRNLALSKNRDPFTAFWMGVLFSLFAVVYYLTVPKNADDHSHNIEPDA